MQYKLIALLVLIVASGAFVFGYLRFLRQRLALYKLVYDFLCEARERVGSELVPLNRVFFDFCECEQVSRALPKGDFSCEAKKYLLQEDGELFFCLLSDAGVSLDLGLQRLSEAQVRFRERLSRMKEATEKTAKIAVTVYAGISLGAILLFI